MRANPGTPISVYNVAALIGEAYGRVATIATAAGAFRGVGIWPVNRYKFQDHNFAPSTILQSDAPEGIESPKAILPPPVDCMVTSFLNQQQNRSLLSLLFPTSYVRNTSVSHILVRHSSKVLHSPGQQQSWPSLSSSLQSTSSAKNMSEPLIPSCRRHSSLPSVYKKTVQFVRDFITADRKQKDM